MVGRSTFCLSRVDLIYNFLIFVKQSQETNFNFGEDEDIGMRSNDRLKSYLETTQKNKQVDRIRSKFDILSFSHQEPNDAEKFLFEKDSESNLVLFSEVDAKNRGVVIKVGGKSGVCNY
jgi:hypothetical protein